MMKKINYFLCHTFKLVVKKLLPVLLFSYLSIPSKAQILTNYVSGHYVSSIAIDAQGNKLVGTDNGLLKFDGTNWTNIFYFNDISRSVYDIAMDAQGNKWIATGGLAKYDGITLTDYTNIDENNKLIGRASSIAFDAQGNKWVGTSQGVSKFNGSTWTNYSVGVVYAIAVDAQNNVWAGTDMNLAKFDGANWTYYTKENTNNGLLSNYVQAITIDARGNKWIGTLKGLSKFDGTTWTNYPITTINNIPSPNGITKIIIDAQGNTWVGTRDGGVSKFNGTTWTNYNITNTNYKLAGNFITSLILDTQGNLWIGTTEGMSKYDGSTWTNLTETSLAHNEVKSVAIDAQGNKWFGTYKGVSKFDGTTWTTYKATNTNNAFLINDVFSIATDAQGNKWFGTNGGGVSKFDGTNWTNYNSTNTNGKLAHNIVTSIAIDAQGNKWFGTNGGGVSKFDGTNWTNYNETNTNNGLSSNSVKTIAIDAQGNKWIGTLNGGLSKFDGTSWSTYKPDGNGILSVYSIAIDAQGNKWCCTGSGNVLKFDGTTWTTYNNSNTNNGLVNDAIESIAIDGQGNIWFGTTSSGVSKFDGTTWKTYSRENTNNVLPGANCIAIDAQGDKWFGTKGGGVYKLVESELPNSVVNLIQNGDFEKGNLGFTTDLKYLAVSDFKEGNYTVGSNTNEWQNNFATCTKNHTPNGKLMFIANGATTPNHKVWSQTVTVLPNTSYKLSMWYTNISDFPDNQKLQFKVNGVFIGQKTTNPPTLCEWANLQTFWNSGNATTALVEIFNFTGIFLGNDFALDDIFMTPLTATEVCPVIEDMTITNLNPKINQSFYQVKEGATIHHYFQVYDKTPAPLKGVVIGYRIKDKVYKSLPSDAKGIVDLNIKLSGLNEDNLSDDILLANAVESVTYEGVDNICPNGISVNQFERFTVKVDPFEGDNLVKGFYAKGTAGVSFCKACIGAEVAGVGASAKAIALNISSGLGFDFAWSKKPDGSTVWNIDMSNSAEISLEASAKITSVIEAKAEAGFEFIDRLKFSNLKPIANRDYLEMLYLLLLNYERDGVNLNSKFSIAMHTLKLGLKHFLGTDFVKMEYDLGTSLSVAAFTSGGVDIGLKKRSKSTNSAVQKSPFSISLLNFGGEAGFEEGFNLERSNQIQTDYFKYFKSWDFQPFVANLELMKDIELTAFPEIGKSRYVIQSSKSKNAELLEASFAAGKQGTTSVGIGVGPVGLSQDMNSGVEEEYTFGKNLLNKVKTDLDNQTFKNEVGKILTGSRVSVATLGTSIAGGVPAEFKDLEAYARLNYNTDWGVGELKSTSKREFTHSTDFDLDLSFDLAFGVGVKAKLGGNIGTYSKATYPLSDKIYHPILARYLKTIDYPTTNKFVNVPPDAAQELWNKIVQAFAALEFDIKQKSWDIVDGFIKSITGKVSENILNLTNWARKWSPFLRSPQPVLATRSTEDFSTLQFIVPEQGKAFAQGTNIKFAYYYPASEVKGRLTNKDTFVIVSDIFFFEANLNGDTLSKAPLGDFSIKCYLGKDDLDFLGYPTTTNVSLMYKSFTDSTWQVVGGLSRNQNNQTFASNKIGIYALGYVYSKGDVTPPTIKFTLPNGLKGTDVIYADITDDKSGVNWSTISVLVNGQYIPFQRDGFTSRIKILASNIPNLQPSEVFFIISGFDVAGNFKRAVATVLTDIKQPELHQNLLKIYPNPTNSEIKIVWNTSNLDDTEFVISDISGRIVHKSTEKSYSDLQQTTLDVHHLSQGVYLLSIRQKRRILDTRKFIKL
jgi:ligand-binding sensor domain-containing protein